MFWIDKFSDEFLKCLNKVEETPQRQDIYTFALMYNVFGKRDFINGLYTEYDKATDRGYTGRIYDFIRECIDNIIKGVEYLNYLLLKAKDEVRKTLKRLIYYGEKNLSYLQNELARVRVFEDLHPTATRQKLNPKAKIILMNELGILNFIHETTQGNTKKTAEIISELTGINAESVRTNIRAVFGYANDKNNPYNNNRNKKQVQNFINS